MLSYIYSSGSGLTWRRTVHGLRSTITAPFRSVTLGAYNYTSLKQIIMVYLHDNLLKFGIGFRIDLAGGAGGWGGGESQYYNLSPKLASPFRYIRNCE